MSKSRGNAVDPWDLMNHEGADALRWYLTTTSPPWSPTRFDRDGVRETSRKVLDTIRNVYSFYAMYAAIDGIAPGAEPGGEAVHSLLDRWILSRFHSTARAARTHMDAYDVTRAARAIQAFVTDELSNWYVRRSRRRFWKGEMGPDKAAAYRTLREVLEGVLRLLAPFTPFVAEEIYLALAGQSARDADGRSVHLERYPEPDESAIDAELERQMEVALAVVSLGRTVRNDAALKTRQPLSELRVHSRDEASLDAFLSNQEIVGLVADELNVRSVRRADSLERLVRLSATPNFPALGKRFGKGVPKVAAAVKALDTEALAAFDRSGTLAVAVDGNETELGRDELSVKVEAIGGWGAKAEHGVTVAVDLRLTRELELEGAAREVINRLQNLRKSAGYDVTDRIRVRYQGDEGVVEVFESQGDLIASETLAADLVRGEVDWKDAVELRIPDGAVKLWIQKTD
jgi:isoleucyl-tRNA synthetase